jgi:hypothetical protein
MYASRSATRCSIDGVAAGKDADVCARKIWGEQKSATKMKTRMSMSMFPRSVIRAAALRQQEKVGEVGRKVSGEDRDNFAIRYYLQT